MWVFPKNRGGPPKSSILIGFSIINHPFWGTNIFGNTNVNSLQVCFFDKGGTEYHPVRLLKCLPQQKERRSMKHARRTP